MDQEEHRQRHVELHKALDELFADFILHNQHIKGFLDVPLSTFLEWSHSQTISPTKEK